MEKLVFRSGLGLLVALTTLPCIALAQPVEPAPAEPAPVAPAAPAVEPLPEPAPSPAAPTMAPVTPEPAVVAAPTPAEPPAEEEAPAPLPTITGYVEAAYHIAFMNPKNDYAVPLHGFYDPTGNSFLLHNAHIAINHSFNDNVSATIEIDAGYDAMLNGSLDRWWGSDSNIPFDVQEAYATYKSGIFSVTAGKFVTYEGIEVVEGPLNPTITRGFLYGYAEPVTHTGVKFHFTGETVDFGIGLVNGWDKLLDNNNFKTFIFKLGLKPSDAFMANLSGTFGAEGENTAAGHRLSLDLTGAWTASPSFALWFQANYGMDGIAADEGDTVKWFGIGLQPTYTSDTFTFGARVELFSDPDNARVAMTDVDKGTYVNVTLTPGFILAQGFKARLELRADIATEDVLGKPDDLGGFQLTGAVGAEYVF